MCFLTIYLGLRSSAQRERREDGSNAIPAFSGFHEMLFSFLWREVVASAHTMQSAPLSAAGDDNRRRKSEEKSHKKRPRIKTKRKCRVMIETRRAITFYSFISNMHFVEAHSESSLCAFRGHFNSASLLVFAKL